MAPLPGLGPESRLARWVGRVTGGRLTPRGLRIGTFLAGTAIVFGFVAMVFAVQVSSTPNFCGTCHIMKPYYDSWKESKHRQIACVECHISPGVTAEIEKKFEALSMVAKYFTATYSQNPWAEVDDAACLRCHERRLLEGKAVFHGVTFDHTPHLTETRRGLHLRCTSCHSQIVQGSHIAVTATTCALCHFKDTPANTGTGACLTCHEIPNRVVGDSTVAFDHGDVARQGMDCRSCHAAVVRGDGRVPHERCVTCHNQPARLAEYENTELLHRKHVSEHKVDCLTCHLQIEHGKVPPGEAIAAEAGSCVSCHGRGHSPQQDLYEGVGGRGVAAMPAPMFLAGVSCGGCHDPALTVMPASAAAGPQGVHSTPASEVACMSCHGPDYAPIFRAWKAGVAERTEALRRQLDASVGAMGVSAPAAFEDARHNFLLVERGRGVHNVNFSYALLEKAHEQMNAARRSRGLGALSRPWTVVAPNSQACLSCHAGIEDQAGRFGGRAFAHRPHVVAGKLDCTSCHRPHAERAPAEVVRFGPQGCVPCHHQSVAEPARCAKCHGDVTTRTVASPRGEFSHAAHLDQGLECATCHGSGAKGDPRPSKAACLQCHVEE